MNSSCLRIHFAFRSARYLSKLQKITSGTGFNLTVGIVYLCQRVVDWGGLALRASLQIRA